MLLFNLAGAPLGNLQDGWYPRKVFLGRVHCTNSSKLTGACAPALTEPLTWGRVLNGVGKGFGFLGHIFTPAFEISL